MIRKFQIIAVTPAGLIDPSIAIAASRAGELGIVDLEFVQDGQAATKALDRMARFTKGPWGVKVCASAYNLVDVLIAACPCGMQCVLLTSTGTHSIKKKVKALQARSITVLQEVTSLPQAFEAVEAGVDGIVAKGNESGGWIGDETAFILLQRLLPEVKLPIWVQGGIGLHTAAGCYAAGAAGVVLDGQLLLARESPLSDDAKMIIARMDGSETRCLGGELGCAFRVLRIPGSQALGASQAPAATIAKDLPAGSRAISAWSKEVGVRVGWDDLETQLQPIGKDAVFARSLAHRFRTVGGILEAVRDTVDSSVTIARRAKPLEEGGPMARSHGTRFPVVQGPMARVSDCAAFCAKVAEAGALPFLGLAMLRGKDVEALLRETRGLLGERAWGVGILGFAPAVVREEQLEAIRQYVPSYAIIAGGRPDQVRSLEQEGIRTYTHVPSAGLLKMLLADGARRFIFEGMECGGHVGPQSSFVLWNMMVETLLESLPNQEALAECHVLFAGGIHDALSASVAAVIGAPLVEKGVRVGVLCGTAYLFTQEAVQTGAVVEGFQQEALECEGTALLESAPGHAVRCATTPYAERFNKEKFRLLQQDKPAQDIRKVLEHLNRGRLRIASRGVQHNPKWDKERKGKRLVKVGKKKQKTEGLYMMGQLAALRDQNLTMDELHNRISKDGCAWLAGLKEPRLSRLSGRVKKRPSDVAIIGMACLMPKASDLESYWERILDKSVTITEVPRERWDWRLYFDPDRGKRDRVYSKWGGFLDPVPFNPVDYGMPPNTLASVEPLQLLVLDTVRKALVDAGYDDRPFSRDRTSVIIGASGGMADLGQQYAFRTALPAFFKDLSPEILSRLPEWTEDSFSGTLMNVAAGRVANRFNLGGVNYAVDAACASSLAAVYSAVRELDNETSDMVIVGGADTFQNPFFFFCFGKTRALSPSGSCRTFDENADGIVISEGIAVLVLKRLRDAERDGDRIYAVIKGIAGSSDGRQRGLTAPHPEGQARALRRAYHMAGIDPATVGLVEAHGTGTVAGDRAEIETLNEVFEAAGTPAQSCALGSVKSIVGHTKGAAGVAGIIKAALALHHKVLPPTAGVTKPNASLEGSPFYLNTALRPWINGTENQPRRAGVSGFGFGGTNFHAVIEEYQENFLDTEVGALTRSWPSEMLFWTGPSRSELSLSLKSLADSLAHGAVPRLADLAQTCWKRARGRAGMKIAIVAASLEDLKTKLALAIEGLKKPGDIHDVRGIFFYNKPLGSEGKVALLFPGQGSQYPGMFGGLAVHFPDVRQAFESADRVLTERFAKPLSAYIFPPPLFSKAEEKARRDDLTRTNVAQPALSAAAMGAARLLRALGVRPDMTAGHSSGEYAALCAAGVFDEQTLYVLTEARGRFIVESAGDDLGTMAAVKAGHNQVKEVIEAVEDVWIANLNAPRQTIISGTRAGVEQATRQFEAKEIKVRPIAVSCGFHCPVVAPAQKRLAEFISGFTFTSPDVDVFSNTTGTLHAEDPKVIADVLSAHLIRPVLFTQEIEQMYEAGARIFIEAGPSSVLTGLTSQILENRPCLAVPIDARGRSGIQQLNNALGQLAAHGVSLDLDMMYRGRKTHALNLDNLEEDTKDQPLAVTTWMVTGGSARPLTKKGEKVLPMEPPFSKHMVPDVNTDAQDRVGQVPDKAKSFHNVSENSPLGQSVAGRSDADEASATVYQDRVERMMARHQGLMQRFLEAQERVMLGYMEHLSSGNDRRDNVRLFDTTPVVGEPSALPPLDTMAPARAAQQGQETGATDERPGSADARGRGESRGAGVSPGVVVADKVPDADSGLDIAAIKDHLLGIVSDRTGYPAEMLDVDLDLEADLGIDSIKRVEIIGALGRQYPDLAKGREAQAQEALAGMKSLRGMMAWIEKAIECNHVVGEKSSENLGDNPGDSIHAETFPDTCEAPLPRFLVTLEDVPRSDGALKISQGSVFVITDDGRGISTALAGEIQRMGAQAVVVRLVAGAEKGPDGCSYMDLTDPDSAVRVIEQARAKGPIAGLIHLSPLQSGPGVQDMDLKAWRQRLCVEVKGLFHLAKAACEDLREAGRSGTGWLLAGTAAGGTFGYEEDDDNGAFYPGHGGIVGLVNTMALEWPEVTCKVVDFHPDVQDSMRVAELVAEMGALDGECQIGITGSRRVALRTQRVLLPESSPVSMNVGSDWVILITGGARGVTAEVALELARKFHPTMVLVGHSEAPEATEDPDTAQITDPAELKKALIERFSQAGQQVKLAQVEKAYIRLLRQREMRKNMAAMEKAGAQVSYFQADVRDESAFGGLIQRIYRDYGRIDGVIHGAGIIEDKLAKDKTLESFDRVFDTKADSAFILSRHLQPQSLRFVVFFSSVVRFGNPGQCDYAATNETVNKLALYLDRHWTGRVVAVLWGPWAKTGMASAEVQRQFARRGIQVIAPQAGCRYMMEELQADRKGEVEVIVGDGPWAASGRKKKGLSPLFDTDKLRHGDQGSVQLNKYLDPDHDRYLKDHILDTRPVFPVAMAMELMAEVALSTWPEMTLVSLQSLQMFRGIILENGTRNIQVVARPEKISEKGDRELGVVMEISGPEKPALPNYRATVTLARQAAKAPSFDPAMLSDLRPFHLTIDEAYARWLFHGPCFQGISDIEGINDHGICAILQSVPPKVCLSHGMAGQWSMDPVVIDSSLQLAILWERAYHDMTPLPVRIQSYRHFDSLSSQPVRCYLQAQTSNQGHILVTHAYYLDQANRVMGILEGVEFSCSKELNRLAQVKYPRIDDN